jgi:hypothetical protein
VSVNSTFPCSYFDPDYPTSGHRRLKLSSKGCNVYDGRQVTAPQNSEVFLLVFVHITAPSVAKGSGRDLFQVNIPEFGCRNRIRLTEA